MKNYDFKFFGGYVWYAYPSNKDDSWAALSPPQAKHSFSIKNFKDADLYANFSEHGLILITDTPERPDVPRWTVFPLTVPEGFGGKVNGNTLIRHVYTLSDTPTAVFSFFVGVELPDKV